MSLRACAYCEQRPTEKLATLFWSWYLADHERVAFRQQLCTLCYCTNVLTISDPPPPGPLLCAACHGPCDDDLDPVYCSEFVPGRGKSVLEIGLCARCAVDVRGRAMKNASRLEERDPVSKGQDPGPSTNFSVDAWNAIGLRRIEP